VSLPIVDVEVERPASSQQTPRFAQAWLEEAEVVLERVSVRRLREQTSRVAASLEADAVAALVRDRLERPATLLLARVERRVDVDELKALLGELR
jgi:hypothetical protein